MNVDVQNLILFAKELGCSVETKAVKKNADGTPMKMGGDSTQRFVKLTVPLQFPRRRRKKAAKK
jgi:hypothetical protein